MNKDKTAINRYCPRSGKPVSYNALTTYQGYCVGFCNPGCRDDFQQDPLKCVSDRAYFDVLIKEKH